MSVNATFDGVSLATAVSSARILAELRRPGMAPNTDVRVHVPGGNDWLFADHPGDGEIMVPIAIVASSWSAVRSATRDLVGWAKSSVRKKLIFSDESDRFWFAKLADEWSVEEMPYCGMTTLRFACLPYAYSTSVTTEGPYSASDNVAHTWSVADEVDAYPNIQIQAPAGGIVGGFTLTVNGDSLVVPQNPGASGYRTVMSSAYTIVNVADPDTELVGSYSAATVDMSGVTGDFGKLVNGNNSVTVNTADGSTTTVTIRWRRRYD